MSSWHPSRPKSNEFPYLSKKKLLTDFKVTQVLTCIFGVLKKLPIESVDTNVLKFDILPPKTGFETSIHIRFGHTWCPLNILTC